MARRIKQIMFLLLAAGAFATAIYLYVSIPGALGGDDGGDPEGVRFTLALTLVLLSAGLTASAFGWRPK